MIYKINQNFQQLGVTSGTVQNTHASYNIELSDDATADSGIILYPRQKFSFTDTTLYARCKGAGGAELRVVTFFAGESSGAGGSAGDSSDIISDADIDSMIDDVFGGGSGSSIDEGNIATQDELDALMDDIFSGGASPAVSDSDVDAMLDDVFGS